MYKHSPPALHRCSLPSWYIHTLLPVPDPPPTPSEFRLQAHPLSPLHLPHALLPPPPHHHQRHHQTHPPSHATPGFSLLRTASLRQSSHPPERLHIQYRSITSTSTGCPEGVPPWLAPAQCFPFPPAKGSNLSKYRSNNRTDYTM
jgi:hypothetical protein